MRKKQRTIRVPADLVANLETIKDKFNIGISEIIRESLIRYVIGQKDFSDFEPIAISNDIDSKRMAIVISEKLKSLIDKKAESLGVSFNSLMIYAIDKNAQYYLKVIEELSL